MIKGGNGQLKVTDTKVNVNEPHQTKNMTLTYLMIGALAVIGTLAVFVRQTN